MINFTPEIEQSFNKGLLSIPVKIGDSSDDLRDCARYIEKKLKKKTLNHPARKRKYQELWNEWERLNVELEKKEKELKEASGLKVQMPFYFIKISDSRYKAVFRRLQYKNFKNRKCE